MSAVVPWDFFPEDTPGTHVVSFFGGGGGGGVSTPESRAWINDPGLRDEVAGSLREALSADGVVGGLEQSLRERAARAGLDLSVEDGRQVVTLDARSRSVRTFLSGLGFDIVFALLALVGTLTGEEFLSKAGLTTLAALALKTVVTTAAAYVARLRFAPTARVSVPALGIHGGDAALAQRVELVTVPVPRPNSRPIGGK